MGQELPFWGMRLQSIRFGILLMPTSAQFTSEPDFWYVTELRLT
jgi:hypothetical protein